MGCLATPHRSDIVAELAVSSAVDVKTETGTNNDGADGDIGVCDSVGTREKLVPPYEWAPRALEGHPCVNGTLPQKRDYNRWPFGYTLFDALVWYWVSLRWPSEPDANYISRNAVAPFSIRRVGRNAVDIGRC